MLAAEWMTGAPSNTLRFASGHPKTRTSLPLLQSGLTQACLTSPHSHDYVATQVLHYIKKRIPYQRVGVLAGNSVHADRSFLVEKMPEVVNWLHYRSLSFLFEWSEDTDVVPLNSIVGTSVFRISDDSWHDVPIPDVSSIKVSKPSSSSRMARTLCS